MRTPNKVIIIFIICILSILGSKETMAQMEAAKKMVMDFDTTVTFNVKRSIVWDLFKDPAKWHEVSNGYILSTELKNDNERNIIFADGTKRSDLITQNEPQNRFIVVKVISPLKSGISSNLFMFTFSAITENSSSMAYRIQIEGKKADKQELLNALKKELYAYIKGINIKLASLSQ